MTVKYDPAKFRNLVLCVAHRLEHDSRGGALKLNKVIFYAEFGHMRAHGHPISGVEFQRLEQGPAPRPLLPVRRLLIDEGRARMEHTSFVGYRQDRLVAIDPPNESAVFSPEEIRSIDQAIDLLAGMNGSEVSEMSHREMGWKLVGDGETIPYEAAFLRTPVLTERVRARMSEIEAEYSGS